MSRYTRNFALRTQVEATYKTDPGSWATTHFVPVRSQPQHILNDSLIDLESLRGYMGAFDKVFSVGSTSLSFGVDLALSGTAGTAPPWGALMRGLGMAATVTAGERVEYTFLSSGHASNAFEYFEDGVKFVDLGARGTGTMMLNAFGIPQMDFEFNALQSTVSTATTPTADFTAWAEKPLAINEANGAEWLIGASYASGVVSGGSVAVNGDMRISFGNVLQHQRLLNGQAVDITDRRVTVSGVLFLDASSEDAYIDALRASTATTLGFNLGADDGNKLSAFIPGAVRTSARTQDYQGRKVLAVEFDAVPTAANNELRIICA